MGSNPVLPTLAELDSFLDPSHSIYGFAINEWIASPSYIPPEGVDSARIYQRLGHADALKQTGTPIAWHRYAILGFYVFDDCSHFDRYWRQFISKRLLCSKMIWYNYMYHVDRNLDIHPKLQAWAQEVARPYLAAVEHSFLIIDTNRLTWNTLVSTSITEMDEDSDLFTEVGTEKSTKKLKSAMKTNPWPLMLDLVHHRIHLRHPHLLSRSSPPWGKQFRNVLRLSWLLHLCLRLPTRESLLQHFPLHLQRMHGLSQLLGLFLRRFVLMKIVTCCLTIKIPPIRRI